MICAGEKIELVTRPFNCQTAQPQQAATSTTYYRTADVPAVTPVTTTSHDVTDGSMAAFLRKALRIEGPQLCERTITIKKTGKFDSLKKIQHTK